MTCCAQADVAHAAALRPPVRPARSGRLLDAARAGAHLDRLYRAAWALCGSREDAEDLVQETYSRVLARPRLLRGEDDLGYLLRTLRNTFFLQLRTQRRRPRTVPLPDEPDAAEERTSLLPQSAAEASEVFRLIL